MLKKLALLLLLLVAPLLADSKLKVEVNPSTVLANSPITQVKITVEKDARNRHLWLIWGVQGLEERAYYQLDGEAAPRIYRRTLKLKNMGENIVKAVVIRNDESDFSAQAVVIVN